MRPFLAALVLTTALTGCALFAPTDTARMPQTSQGAPEINLDEAISLPGYALRNPSYTHGNPARAARAIAAEDWLAGQWRLTPQFGEYGPVNEWVWGVFRREVRGAIGVAPQATSQELIDRLLAVQKALDAGDAAGARAQLQSPIFTLGPDATLGALSTLPLFPHLEQAYADLRRNVDRQFGPDHMGIFH